ncbi:hypothetical protein Tco_0695999, partial [Tanacetum coccineum]
MPGGIDSSEARNKSISSIRELLSLTGIRSGEKDSIIVLVISALSSSGGHGDELSYDKFSTRRISSSRSKSVSSILGGIGL